MLSENTRRLGRFPIRLIDEMPKATTQSSCAKTVALSATLILISALVGCGGSSSETSASAGRQAVTKTNSEELLRSALNLLQEEEEGDLLDQRQEPERSFARVRELLNQWLQTGGEEEQLSLDAAVRRQLEQTFNADELAEIEADRFSQGDAEHLRRCFVLRDVAMRTQGDADLVLDRAHAIFAWIWINIHPLDPEHDSAHVSLGPYYTLLTGRGGPPEQAWLFVVLLRQLNVDAVLVAHADANDLDRFVPWAVGVLDDDEIYLFDFLHGRPVTDPAGEKPVTLRAATEKPELIQPKGPKGEALDPARPALFLESDPFYWAPRMQLLESKLAGEQAAVLSYSLEALTRRAAEAAGEAIADRIILWPFPLEVCRQVRTGDDNFEQARLFSLGPLAVFPILVNTRIRQLRGDWERAIPELQQVNIDKQQAKDLTRSLQGFLDQAAEASIYWLGLCQYEQGEFALAADWLRMYLERYEKDRDGKPGRWAPGAQALLDQAVAKQKPEAKEKPSGQ